MVYSSYLLVLVLQHDECFTFIYFTFLYKVIAITYIYQTDILYNYIDKIYIKSFA